MRNLFSRITGSNLFPLYSHDTFCSKKCMFVCKTKCNFAVRIPFFFYFFFRGVIQYWIKKFRTVYFLVEHNFFLRFQTNFKVIIENKVQYLIIRAVKFSIFHIKVNIIIEGDVAHWKDVGLITRRFLYRILPWLLLFILGKDDLLLFPLSTQQYLKWEWDAKTVKKLLVA